MLQLVMHGPERNKLVVNQSQEVDGGGLLFRSEKGPVGARIGLLTKHPDSFLHDVYAALAMGEEGVNVKFDDGDGLGGSIVAESRFHPVRLTIGEYTVYLTEDDLFVLADWCRQLPS